MTDLNNPSAGPQGSETLEGETKTMVTLAHVLGIVFPALPAFLILTLKKEQLPGIEPQCKEAINFQLTAFIAILLSTFVCLSPLVWLTYVVFTIIATLSVNNGQPYTYPWKINIIK